MSENQQPAIQRNWSEITEPEQQLIKLFYMNGESLATCARVWNLNFNGLRQIAFQRKWKEAREESLTDLTTKETALKHVKFMLKVFDMMERIHAGYSETLDRHLIHDQFQSFPFERYYQFLEMYAKSVDLLGGVKTISHDVTMYLQQNVQNNLNISGNGEQASDGENTVPLNDRESKAALSKLLQRIVIKTRPPEPKEIETTAVENEDSGPDPARGKFR